MSDVNRAAEFLPQTSDDERPAVRVGEALIFAYFDEDGALRVTVDTEDMTGRVRVKVNINDCTVFEDRVG